MRLIDADALIEQMKNTWDMQDLYLPVHFADLVDEQTIVDKLDFEYFDEICLCAMRYALGRETYMPGIVQDFIRTHVKELRPATISVMIRDIDEADYIRQYTTINGSTVTVDGLGDTNIDRPGWENLRTFLKEYTKESV